MKKKSVLFLIGIVLVSILLVGGIIFFVTKNYIVEKKYSDNEMINNFILDIKDGKKLSYNTTLFDYDIIKDDLDSFKNPPKYWYYEVGSDGKMVNECSSSMPVDATELNELELAKNSDIKCIDDIPLHGDGSYYLVLLENNELYAIFHDTKKIDLIATNVIAWGPYWSTNYQPFFQNHPLYYYVKTSDSKIYVYDTKAKRLVLLDEFAKEEIRLYDEYSAKYAPTLTSYGILRDENGKILLKNIKSFGGFVSLDYRLAFFIDSSNNFYIADSPQSNLIKDLTLVAKVKDIKKTMDEISKLNVIFENGAELTLYLNTIFNS